jgi:hypothetical protein
VVFGTNQEHVSKQSNLQKYRRKIRIPSHAGQAFTANTVPKDATFHTYFFPHACSDAGGASRVMAALDKHMSHEPTKPDQ